MMITMRFDTSTTARSGSQWFRLHYGTVETQRVGDVGLSWLHLYDQHHQGEQGKAPVIVQFGSAEELHTLIRGLEQAYAQLRTQEDV